MIGYCHADALLALELIGAFIVAIFVIAWLKDHDIY